jgi:hypothetical protein
MTIYTLSHRGRNLPDRRRKRRAAARLQVEALEQRSLLSAGYWFQALAELGSNAPPVGGGDDGVTFTFDFEPGELNSRGQVAFGADLSRGGEGVFLTDARGQLITLARTGDTSPDGRTYGPIFLGTVTNNDTGEAAFVIHRDGYTFPALFARDAGLYRYTPRTGVAAELLSGVAAPGGGTFHGYNFRPSMNNGGTIAFSGLIETDLGPGGASGLGFGIFTVDKDHQIAKVMRPGDGAPGGNTFDFGQNPWINENGDVAFGGHVKEDPFIEFTASYPAGNQIFTAESIFLWNKQDGQIVQLARQNVTSVPGDPGFTFNYAFGPELNNRGEVAYFGAYGKAVDGTFLIPGDGGTLVNNTGIFLYSHGATVAVAKPGDAMPGGGTMISAGFLTGELGLSNQGDVTFTATLNTDDNGDGLNDTGLYSYSHGTLSLIARSGTVLPDIGTIQSLHSPDELGNPTAIAGAATNERGQVVFQAALTSGDGVMLLATPRGQGHPATAKSTAAVYGMAAGRPLVPVAPLVDQVLPGMVPNDAVASATGVSLFGKKKK